MIVAIGGLLWRAGEPGAADGHALSIARAATLAGATVQVVGKVGDDPDGDQLLADLARAGIGHVAVLRDAAARTPVVAPLPDDDEADDQPLPPTEGLGLDAADVELALRYLTDFRVVVVADPLSTDARRAVADAASFAGAHLVVVADPASHGDDIPGGSTVLAGPASGDAEGFGRLVGTYAAAIDRGIDPAAAFDEAAAAVGLEP